MANSLFNLPTETDAHLRMPSFFQKLWAPWRAIQEAERAPDPEVVEDPAVIQAAREYRAFLDVENRAKTEKERRGDALKQRLAELQCDAKVIQAGAFTVSFSAVESAVCDQETLQRLHPDAFTVVPAGVRMNVKGKVQPATARVALEALQPIAKAS